MTGFNLVQDILNTPAEEVTISSLTLAAGDLLEQDVGVATMTEADSASEHWQRKYVCIAAATSSDTTVLAIPVNPYTQLWEVESANNSNSSHNGDRMVLTDKNTVNNSGTDSTAEEACVMQVGVAGAAADKRILVRFAGTCDGINPDAA